MKDGAKKEELKAGDYFDNKGVVFKDYKIPFGKTLGFHKTCVEGYYISMKRGGKTLGSLLKNIGLFKNKLNTNLHNIKKI